MDIIIGKHSFNVQTLKSISKEKAVINFDNIDIGIVERAWTQANPKRARKKSSIKKTK